MHPGEVTLLLRKLGAGESAAGERLAELLYSELRRLAAMRLRAEKPGNTLTPTELANEIWLRLCQGHCELQNRNHFFAVAATAMRRLLIDRARAHHSAKRGGRVAIPVEQIDVAAPQASQQILALNDALDRLLQVNPRAARVTELKYFGGLTHDEIAALLSVDRRTIDRDWAFAKAWLFQDLGGVNAAEDRQPHE